MQWMAYDNRYNKMKRESEKDAFRSCINGIDQKRYSLSLSLRLNSFRRFIVGCWKKIKFYRWPTMMTMNETHTIKDNWSTSLGKYMPCIKAHLSQLDFLLFPFLFFFFSPPLHLLLLLVLLLRFLRLDVIRWQRWWLLARLVRLLNRMSNKKSSVGGRSYLYAILTTKREREMMMKLMIIVRHRRKKANKMVLVTQRPTITKLKFASEDR